MLIENNTPIIIAQRHLIEFQISVRCVVNRNRWFAICLESTIAIKVVRIDCNVPTTGDQFIRHFDIGDLITARYRKPIFLTRFFILGCCPQAKFLHLIFQDCLFLQVSHIGGHLILSDSLAFIGFQQFIQLVPLRRQAVGIVHRPSLDLLDDVLHRVRTFIHIADSTHGAIRLEGRLYAVILGIHDGDFITASILPAINRHTVWYG